MKAHVFSSINAFVMLSSCAWYLTEVKTGYALGSILFAVVMLVQNQGLMNGNRPAINIVTVMTVASLINVVPLLHAIDYRDTPAIYVFGGSLASSCLSLVFLILLICRRRIRT